MSERISAAQYHLLGNGRSKYGNKKVVDFGYTFDSQVEFIRFCELKCLERAGEIFELEVHPKFTLVPKTKTRKSVTYTADFRYKVKAGEEYVLRFSDPTRSNNLEAVPVDRFFTVVEDVKSVVTAKDKTYIVKRNIFEFQNPKIEFREIIR